MSDLFHHLWPVQPGFSYMAGSLFHPIILNQRTVNEYEVDGNGFPDTIRLNRINTIRTMMTTFCTTVMGSTPAHPTGTGEFISETPLSIGDVFGSGGGYTFTQAFSGSWKYIRGNYASSLPGSNGTGYWWLQPFGDIADAVMAKMGSGGVIPSAFAGQFITASIFNYQHISLSVYNLSSTKTLWNDTFISGANRTAWNTHFQNNDWMFYPTGGYQKIINYSDSNSVTDNKRIIVYMPTVRIDVSKIERLRNLGNFTGTLGRFEIGSSIMHCDDIRPCSQAGVYELINCVYGREGSAMPPKFTISTVITFCPRINVRFNQDSTSENDTTIHTGTYNAVGHTMPSGGGTYLVNSQPHLYGYFGPMFHNIGETTTYSPTGIPSEKVSTLKALCDTGSFSSLTPIVSGSQAPEYEDSRFKSNDLAAPQYLANMDSTIFGKLACNAYTANPMSALTFTTLTVLLLWQKSSNRMWAHSIPLITSTGSISANTLIATWILTDFRGNTIVPSTISATEVFTDSNRRGHNRNFFSAQINNFSGTFTAAGGTLYARHGNVFKYSSTPTTFSNSANIQIVGQGVIRNTTNHFGSSVNTTFLYTNATVTDKNGGFVDSDNHAYPAGGFSTTAIEVLDEAGEIRLEGSNFFGPNDIQFKLLAFGDFSNPGGSNVFRFNYKKRRNASGSETSNFDYATEAEAETAAYNANIPLLSNVVTQITSTSSGAAIVITVPVMPTHIDRTYAGTLDIRFAGTGATMRETHGHTVSYNQDNSAEWTPSQVQIKVERSVDNAAFTLVSTKTISIGSGTSSESQFRKFFDYVIVKPHTNPRGFDFNYSTSYRAYDGYSTGTDSVSLDMSGVVTQVRYRFSLDTTTSNVGDPNSISFNGGSGSLGFNICNPLNQGNYCMTEDTDVNSPTYTFWRYSAARAGVTESEHIANLGISINVPYQGERSGTFPTRSGMGVSFEYTRGSNLGPNATYDRQVDYSGATGFQAEKNTQPWVNTPATMAGIQTGYMNTAATKYSTNITFDEAFRNTASYVPFLMAETYWPTGLVKNLVLPNNYGVTLLGGTKTTQYSIKAVPDSDATERVYCCPVGTQFKGFHRGGPVIKSKSWLGNTTSISSNKITCSATSPGLDLITATDQNSQDGFCQVQFISGRIPRLYGGMFFREMNEGTAYVGGGILFNIALAFTTFNPTPEFIFVKWKDDINYNQNAVGTYNLVSLWTNPATFLEETLIDIPFNVMEATKVGTNIIPGKTGVQYNISDSLPVTPFIAEFRNGIYILNQEFTDLITTPNGYEFNIDLAPGHIFNTSYTYFFVYKIPGEPLYGRANLGFTILPSNTVP